MRYNDVRIPADQSSASAVKGSPSRRPVSAAAGSTMPCGPWDWSARRRHDVRAGASRRTQGEELAAQAAVQEMIADSWIQLEQFRLLVLQTAWKIDRYNDYRKVRADISAVKAAMPQVLHDVAPRALQIHGSLGASEEMPFGAMIMESFHMGLVDGATEVHKITLARELLKGYKPASGLFPATHLPRLAAEARSRYHDVLARAAQRGGLS